jgi:hypothetical protein
VPGSLRSYHVVAETELGVHIKTMSLTTDADEAFTRGLATDLRTLANRLEAEGRTPSIKRKLLSSSSRAPPGAWPSCRGPADGSRPGRHDHRRGLSAGNRPPGVGKLVR